MSKTTTKLTTTRGELTYMRGQIGWVGLLPRPVTPEGMDGCTVALQTRRQAGGLAARAVITNKTTRRVRLQAIRWVSNLAKLWPPQTLRFPRSLEPQYFATENFRGDYFGTGTTRGEYFCKPLPHEMVTLGFTEDSSFPGLFIASATEPLGLLCAAGSSDLLSATFRLYGGDGLSTWNFEIEQVPQGLPWLEVAPGESVTGDWIFFSIADTNDPQQATGPYYAWLRKLGTFARLAKNPLPRQRIWGSWNFGPMDQVDEAYILRQLPVLRERFPSVKFVQVDDGYERVYPSGQRAQIDLLYGGGEAYDRTKFPNGPRELVRKIKEAGLRPATWLGLWVAGTSPLAQENPGWLLRDDMGRRLAFGSMFAATTGKAAEICLLDPSVPAVRKYLDHVLKTVFCDWGFEGLKFDFSSFAFQIRRARFRHGGQTACQHQRWLVDTCRKYLVPDGFLGMCSVAGTGSPFQGPADYFRHAEDISHGGWDLLKRVALWTVNTYMLQHEHPVLPNIDSIGWSSIFSPTQWQTFLALCAVTGGTLEIAGDLATLEDERIDMMNRCLNLTDPLRATRVLDIPRGKLSNPPAYWLSQAPRRGCLAAVFNWTDRPAKLSTTPLDAALPGWRKLRPAWETQAKITRSSIRLPAQASLLIGDLP